MIEFFKSESCGQCTPCRVGCEKAVNIMKQKDWDISLLEDLCEVMESSSICGLGQAATGIADIGRLQSELGRADIGMLSQLGRIGQQQSQAELDAQRQNLMQGIMEPFTRLELGSSLLKGTPSGGLASTFKSATTPEANPFLQGVGAYTALQGAGVTGK